MQNLPSLIAAIAFAVLVLFAAYPLFKLGKLFDQLRESSRDVATSADQAVQEVTATVRDAHGQLANVDTVTTASARVAQDVSAISTLISTSVGRPLIKLAAFSLTTRQALARRRAQQDAAVVGERGPRPGFYESLRVNEQDIENAVFTSEVTPRTPSSNKNM